jgi:capsular polysaccharide biosynthesis protein
MNKENTNELNYNDEEISIKELISVLLKEKKLIAIITIIAVSLTALYSFFILNTEYENKTLINVEIKETPTNGNSIETPYGTFENPYVKLDDYIRLVKDSKVLEMTAGDMEGTYTEGGISNRIKTEVISEGRAFAINVKGSNDEEVYSITKAHTNNYIQFLQYDLTNKAIDYLYNKNDSDINILEKKLEDNNEDMKKAQELLKNTAKTIDLENALLSQADYSQFVSNGQFNSQDFKGQRIISQEVHPSYVLIANKITELDIERNNLLNSLEVAKKNVEELSKERQAMEEYKEIPSEEELNIGISQAMKNIVTISQGPLAESEEINPRYTLNFAIAIVLGLMLGVFVAFFKDYWKKS